MVNVKRLSGRRRVALAALVVLAAAALYAVGAYAPSALALDAQDTAQPAAQEGALGAAAVSGQGQAAEARQAGEEGGSADLADDPHKHCVCGSTTCSGEGHNPNQEWEAWTDAASLPTSGYHYLTTDVSAPGSGIDSSVHICLNGHVVRLSSGIRVNDAATLAFTDCKPDEKHYFTYHKDAAWERNETASAGAVPWSSIDDTTTDGTPVEVDGGAIVPIQAVLEPTSSSTLVLNNINIVGASYPSKAYLVAMIDNTKLAMDNCRVLGCYTTGVEISMILIGHTYASGSDDNASATLSNCTFRNNVTNDQQRLINRAFGSMCG